MRGVSQHPRQGAPTPLHQDHSQSEHQGDGSGQRRVASKLIKVFCDEEGVNRRHRTLELHSGNKTKIITIGPQKPQKQISVEDFIAFGLARDFSDEALMDTATFVLRSLGKNYVEKPPPPPDHQGWRPAAKVDGVEGRGVHGPSASRCVLSACQHFLLVLGILLPPCCVSCTTQTCDGSWRRRRPRPCCLSSSEQPQPSLGGAYPHILLVVVDLLVHEEPVWSEGASPCQLRHQ